MNTDSKIYVSGHRGLVGSSIIRKLQEQGFVDILTRTSSELDLRNQADTEAFFEQLRPEYVLLAAAKVGGIIANNTYRAQFIYENLAIACNVIHASYKYGVKKLLFHRLGLQGQKVQGINPNLGNFQDFGKSFNDCDSNSYAGKSSGSLCNYQQFNFGWL